MTQLDAQYENESLFERDRSYKTKIKYAELTIRDKKYDLVFGDPTDMLEEPYLSWQAKGYLSYIACIDQIPEVDSAIIMELIHLGYFIEVAK